jgi:metal-responsive CopG/Arc/MetJ family transcriptional regulator
MSPAGRPEIGQPINVRLGDELLAAVDRMADRQGLSRAEMIRLILSDYFAGEVPDVR